MTPKRMGELEKFADKVLDEIIESLWFEIGSWDGYLEDGELTYKELQWIWNNLSVQSSVVVGGNYG